MGFRCWRAVWEKYFIICKPELASLNKRNELVTSCRHANKFLLKNFKPTIATRLYLFKSEIGARATVEIQIQIPRANASRVSKRCNVRCIWQFYLKSAAHKLCSMKLNSNKNAKSHLLMITSRRLYKSSGSPMEHFSTDLQIKYIYIYIYIYVWIRENVATEFDLSLIIAIQFCPSASFPQGLS